MNDHGSRVPRSSNPPLYRRINDHGSDAMCERIISDQRGAHDKHASVSCLCLWRGRQMRRPKSDALAEPTCRSLNSQTKDHTFGSFLQEHVFGSDGLY